MKNIRKYWGLLCLLLLLIPVCSGCGKSKAATEVKMDDCSQVTYVKEQEGVQMSMTFFYIGDQVYYQTADNSYTYEAMGVKSREEAEQLLKPVLKKYNAIAGISDEINYDEKRATEHMTVDYGKVDLKKLEDLPGAVFTNPDGKYVSLKQSEAQLVQQGFKKK